MAFRRLWVGQIISNLGTQVCLYALALWLFRRDGQLSGVAAVAVVVQLAKVATMPWLGRWLPRWPRRRVMLLSNAVSCCSTLTLVTLLSLQSSRMLHQGVWPLLAVAASAEAVLALCLATLIPVVVPQPHWAAVNGWLVAAEGVVNMAAPYLGALVVLHLGLAGIASLDLCSTLVAMVSVSWGRWSPAALAPSGLGSMRAPPGLRGQIRRLLAVPFTRSLLLLGAGLMAACAAIEVLFPAWVLVGLPPGTLGRALLFGGLAYGAGTLVWQRWARFHSKIWLLCGLLLQGVLLLAAGWEGFEHLLPLWLLGAAAFNFAVPINTAALQTLWQVSVPLAEQVPCFASRNVFDWGARLMAVLLAGTLADHGVPAALQPGGVLAWAGAGPGRPMAVLLALMGLGQLLLLLWQGPRLLRSAA